MTMLALTEMQPRRKTVLAATILTFQNCHSLPSPRLPKGTHPCVFFPHEVIYNVAEQSVYMLSKPLLAGITVKLERLIVHSVLTTGIYGEILRIISVLFLSSLKIISANNQLVLAMMSSTFCITEGPGSANPQRGAVSSQQLRRRGLWRSSHLQRLPGRYHLAREGEVIELELGALPVGAKQLSLLDV